MKLSERKKIVVAIINNQQEIYDILVDEDSWMDDVCIVAIEGHDIKYLRKQLSNDQYRLHDDTLNVIKDAETFEQCVADYVADKFKMDEHWTSWDNSEPVTKVESVWFKMMEDEVPRKKYNSLKELLEDSGKK